MSKDKDNTQANPSKQPQHGSGDRNGSAYVTPGNSGASEGVDKRYGPNHSESQGGSVDDAPDKTADR